MMKTWRYMSLAAGMVLMLVGCENSLPENQNLGIKPATEEIIPEANQQNCTQQVINTIKDGAKRRAFATQCLAVPGYRPSSGMSWSLRGVEP